MSQFKDVEVGSVAYFWFAANLTTGAAGDGATPLYDVRLAGALADAIPTASGTPMLLTHADYSPGLHEIAIDTTGYAAGEYAVFCTLTISTVNPAGFCGSFRVVAVGDSLHSAAARVMDAVPNAVAGANGGLFIAGSNADTTVNITGTVSTVTTLTNLPAITAGWLTAAGIAAAALDGKGNWNIGKTGYSLAVAPPTAAEIVTAIEGVGTKLTVLYTDWLDSGRLDLIIDAIKAKTDNLPTDPADESAVEAAITAATSGLATAANLATVAGYIDTEVNSILAAVDTEIGTLATAIADLPTNTELATAFATALSTTTIAEDYPADGAAATPAELLYLILSCVSQFDITATTLTARKLDGTTQAAAFTLDSATSPTSRYRSA